MLHKYVFLLVILILFPLLNYAQTAQGCLLPNGVVYTDPVVLGSSYKLSGGQVALSGSYCSWTPTSGSACIVCSSLAGLICLDFSPASGIAGTFTMQACPLDDYTWLLVLSAASIAVFKIRNKYS